MKNSSKFFANRDCAYYPCHKTEKDLNCLFCYCPLYLMKNCPGNFVLTECGEGVIKDCSGCTFPHRAENYDVIMQILANEFPSDLFV